MRKILLTVVILSVYGFSENIILSKDSLKASNDSLFIINNSEKSIALDSAYIIFSHFDTTGMHDYLSSGGKLEIYWMEHSNEADFKWDLQTIEENRYKLIKNYFYPNNATPIQCAPYDSCCLNKFEIGIYLLSAHYPIYPKFLKGTLMLYFNNNEMLEIRLYSNVLGTYIHINNKEINQDKNNYNFEYISLQGKRVMAKNRKAKNVIILQKNGITKKELNFNGKRY